MSRIRATRRLALASAAILAASVAAQQPTVLRTEQQLTISIETPALGTNQCEASNSTSYHQRNTVARLESTIQVAGCGGAASGKFTVTVRTRDESGAVQSLEFDETWQRSDGREVSLVSDYPIGENVELVSVRVRGITCTCADAPQGPAQTED